jgi:hypothetical protein
LTRIRWYIDIGADGFDQAIPQDDGCGRMLDAGAYEDACIRQCMDTRRVLTNAFGRASVNLCESVRPEGKRQQTEGNSDPKSCTVWEQHPAFLRCVVETSISR